MNDLRITRAKTRGKKLDDMCKKAYTTTHEYGKNDNRVFCYGIEDKMTDKLFEKCKACKAYVRNAEPVESEEPK